MSVAVDKEIIKAITFWYSALALDFHSRVCCWSVIGQSPRLGMRVPVKGCVGKFTFANTP